MVYYIRDIFTTTSFFNSWVDLIQARNLMEEATKEEFLEVLKSFQHGKSLAPNGWAIMFYLGFWYLISDNIVVAIEESKYSGMVHPPFNSSFISNIPKYDFPSGFDHYRPISVSNCIYKVVSKVISVYINPILSNYIP